MVEHFFWIVSRGAGIAALLLASGGVALGLLMGGRMPKGWRRDVRPLHEALSLATMAALALHALALLGDGFLSPSLADIAVPFALDHEPFWTGVGVIAGWLLVALGLSFYVRAWIGAARWRSLHRFTALAWLMAVGHSLGSGTDTGRWWFQAACATVVVPTLFLLARRLRPPPATTRGVAA
jgi:sulfoxide reductase heme-binding subunit YedZ